MPLISVLIYCYSRQKHLDLTLPKWVDQEGVDYEVIVGKGPGIGVPEHPRVKTIDIPQQRFNWAYNQILGAAKGEILLITQCDMEVNSKTQLKRMYDTWNPRRMVTEKFFKDGKRDNGLYLQFMMVAKEAVVKAGGWCELYDNPETAAHEDADLVATMLENGLDIYHTETAEEEGVYHINHPRPDYHGDPTMVIRLKKGKELFDSRHKQGIMALYARQFARMLMQKRVMV